MKIAIKNITCERTFFLNFVALSKATESKQFKVDIHSSVWVLIPNFLNYEY